MGMFEVQVKLANPGEPSRSSDISLLVDTGATLSWVPRELLQRLGVRPTTRLEFQLADGRTTLRDVGAALFTLDGKTLTIPCAFAEPGEESVLGATALEALGFVVDPVEKKLIPRRLMALTANAQSSPGTPLRKEFNRWAEDGRGEEMEQDHLPITLPVLEKMRLAPTDNVLDVGCGAGWLSRRLAKLVPDGRVVGMDISDEMIRHARRSSVDFGNLIFVTGEVIQIPWQPHFFSHAISVESSYYWPDPAAGLKDIFRVVREGGSAWILINYYRDNPHSHQWGSLLSVPAHLLSGEEWGGLFREAGFTNVAHERVVDRSPSPEVYTGPWFRDAQQLRAFKAEGALLIHGAKE
jgi:arsenite methyltransferase